MKKAILILSAFTLFGCDNPPAGTVTKISQNETIELHKYYYTDGGSYVYVARYKDEPTVSTTTWFEKRGKQTVQCTVISIDTCKTN